MNNIKAIYFILIFASLLLNACGDCSQRLIGVVLDEATKQPIDSVYIHKENYAGEYSDSTGQFQIHAISGGLTGCPLLKLSFSKPGYKTITGEYENSNDKTINLEKVK